MKRLVLLYCALTTYAVHAQLSQNFANPFGTWGIGRIQSESSLHIFERYHIEGFHLYYNWSVLEPEKNVFAWAELDRQLQIIADQDLWIGVQIMVGQNSPLWIYSSVPVVVTIGGHDPGPYPYYFDPDYKERYFNLLRQVAQHFKNLPPGIKKHFMYWQICEGSTGDEQPYKGEPINSSYHIGYYDWEDFRHQCWDSANTYAGNDRQFRFLFNSGNRAQDLEYVLTKYPGDFHKGGFLSHKYSFDGELLYYARQLNHINATFFRNRTRGEVQGIYNYPWWQMAPVKQSFTLACSALSGGLDMMNVGADYIGATLDKRPTDFFKKYAGLRKASESNRAFIALRDVPDFIDELRFPVEEYGQVIDPQKEVAYNAQVAAIKHNPRDSAANKFWKIMQVTERCLNPARRDMIIREFTPAGAMYNDNGDGYHNDFGIYMTKNFTRFILQLAPDSTSIGAWRVGKDSSIYGRYARLCKLDGNNHGQMFFRFFDSLVKDNRTVNVNLSIVFYDTASGRWSVNGGGSDSVVVKNKNTNEWKQKIIKIKNFQPRTLLDGQADFSIRYESGANTPFALIEVSIEDAQDTGLVASSPQVNREDLNLKFWPNPNNGRFKVELTAPRDEVYSISITNAGGTTFVSGSKSATAGINTWDFSLPNLQTGVYVLHIQSFKTSVTRHFMVEK